MGGHARTCDGSPWAPLGRKTVETWTTGRARRNRVRVRRSADGTIRFEWYEDGKQQVAFGFPRSTKITDEIKDRARAKARALLPARLTHQPESVIVAMKADLVRVARLLGLPAGYAPAREAYQGRGRWSWECIAAAFAGYRSKRTDGHKQGGPLMTWTQAIRRFGLQPAFELRRARHVPMVQDVLRVAREIGRPHELPSAHRYRLMGHHSARSVIQTLGVRTWTEVGPALGLAVPAFRLSARDRARGNTTAADAARRRLAHPTTPEQPGVSTRREAA